MITRVTLLPDNRCLVHVGHDKIEMPVKQALSQKKFARQYLNATNRTWPMMDGWLFHNLIRKRFYAAGYDFGGGQ